MPQLLHEPGPQPNRLVRALVVAWRSLVAYPPGHPALIGALDNAHRRLTDLITSKGPVVIGIAREGLFTETTKLDSPHARRLGDALYARGVAILRIEPGVEVWELESFFRLLAEDPRQAAEGHLSDRLVATGATHVVLQPMDYSALKVTDELRPVGDTASPAEREPVWDRLVRVLLLRTQLSDDATALWDEVLRALLAGEPPSDGTPEAASRGSLSGPDIAALVADHRRETRASAPLRAVHPARAPGAARALAARQIAELVSKLPQMVRETVLHSAIRALASDEGAAEALHALSSPFAPDDVLKGLQQLESQGATLSSHALRLAKTLATLSRVPSSETADPEQTDTFSSALVTFFRDEDIDRFNPEDHQALLTSISVEWPEIAPYAGGTLADLGDRVMSLADDCLTAQLTRALLEMLGQHRTREGFGGLVARLGALFRLCLTEGRFDQAAEIVETMRDLRDDRQTPPLLRSALQDTLGQMASADTLAALVVSLSPPWHESVVAASHVVERLGPVATRNVLVLLIEEPNRSRRRRIFDALASLGAAVVNPAIQWLSDPRWYVVRNMIALLHAVGDRSSLPEVRRFAFHPDLRVRVEALKSLLTLDADRSRDILDRALTDRDPKVAEIAVALAGRHGSPEVIDPLVRVLAKWDPLGRQRSLRLRALRALGELAHPAALPRLRRFFRSWHLPGVAIEEQRAAFESLELYPEFARRPVVRKGLKSRDPVIRDICRRLADTA